jgi:hypothetical protein
LLCHCHVFIVDTKWQHDFEQPEWLNQLDVLLEKGTYTAILNLITASVRTERIQSMQLGDCDVHI